MFVPIPGGPRKRAVRPLVVGPGRLRKVGLIGGSPQSLRFCPWQDPSWEFWAHSSAVLAIPYLRPDRLFDLHPKHCFMEARKNGFKDYFAFLKGCPVLIYMQQNFEDVPQSVRYPLEVIKSLWPTVPIGSQTAAMVALALYEGVTHLGFWGVDYQHETEYAKQRANAERWVGIAEGLGVHIILPPTTPFCREPTKTYGYESHATPEDYARIKAEFQEFKRTHAPKGTFNRGALKRLETLADAIQADRTLRAAQPDWVREAAKMADDESIPPEILEQEARDREQALALAQRRAQEISKVAEPGKDDPPAAPPESLPSGSGPEPEAPSGAR